MRTLIIALAFLLPSLLRAQAPAANPPLLIFVDTAGVVAWPDGNDVYATWIFAKATPTSLPSSGILVAFDCGKHLVKRLAHVVYHLSPGDSTSVTGQIVEDNGGWVDVSIPRLFKLVCDLGREHGNAGAAAPDVPVPWHPKPESQYPIS